MRFSNQCDGMNMTGCEGFHYLAENGTFWEKLLINHQIELGLVLGALLIVLFLFLSINTTKSTKVKKK